LYGVKESELRVLSQEKQGPTEQQREGGENYYKLVAVLGNGRMVSVYDGETEYKIGETVSERPRREHNGGIYVYPSLEAAERTHSMAIVPEVSAYHPHRHPASGYAILRCRCEGSYYRYPGKAYTFENNKLAFHKVTPLEVVKEL